MGILDHVHDKLKHENLQHTNLQHENFQIYGTSWLPLLEVK